MKDDQAARVKTRGDEGLKSLSKVVRILECFSVNDRALSLATICQRTGFPKSTTHRLVASMREVGFLDQDRERDSYRLGLRLFEFGDIVLANLDVRREARPMMESLQHMTGQTVHLAVFDGMQAVVIHRVGTGNESHTKAGMIENAPVHCTSIGKAILAFQTEEAVERVISAGMSRYTDQTMTDPDDLRRALAEIREKGYAVDNEEHQPGLRCLGAPIHDQNGRVFAGISVNGPAWQIPENEIPDLAKIVVYQARVISQRLGWHD
ncbi:IclR family transcriptional regulator [Martelella sp. AD-3]|uniref:IclR family transcriptional regulator n=1 Tax=Martelella sp. AD-3 TaxID=686597 RepID=UPI0004641E5D|nr:IclR family transcriptional regulator [Martelella sp. AD-3]AMM85573.1 transcriptional regulator [Martelella sp. AD-3]MAM10824.1 IclR family transcriptional regulator [Rhizobiaceae bacterium]